MKRLIKLISIALCLSLALSASLVGVFALSLNGVTLGSSGSKATPDEAPLYKDETVYVMAKADGKVDRVIVSDWIKNNRHADNITDVAALGDIENVKTDATYTLNSNQMRMWNAQGEDLYLQGSGSSDLPVDLGVTYALDGKLITPDQLKGKSGRVTIRFDYTNNQYETVEIDGKKERIYVPFLMMTGLFLDSDKFTDVTVTNGKVISDGERIIIAGIAFPGMRHDLGLTKNEIDIPDYVEITAETSDFALGTTVTIATNGLLNNLNADQLDSLDSLKDSLNQLTDAMAALIDGSSQLYTGLQTLLEKSGELTEGVDRLYIGAEKLEAGAQQIDAGAGELKDGASALSLGTVTLSDGMLSLSEGLANLEANSEKLTDGSNETFLMILAAAQKSLTEAGMNTPELTPENYTEVLDALSDSISDENIQTTAEAAAREQVTAKVEGNRDIIRSTVTDAVREDVAAQVREGARVQVIEKILTVFGYTTEEYEAAVAAGKVSAVTQKLMNTAVDQMMQSDEVQKKINETVEETMQSDKVQGIIEEKTQEKINELIEENMQSEEVQNAISEAVSRAAAGRESIMNLKSQLDGYQQLNTGIKAYTGGVDTASQGAGRIYLGSVQLSDGALQLSSGASQLKGGTEQLSAGTSELKTGLFTLKNSVPALVDGVSQLRDGAMQLSDGLRQFNEQGISRITELFDGNLSKLAPRLKAMIDVSKRYKSYSGLTDDMDGEVKFIYKTDEIE
jgi:putative membrane protein